MQSFTRSLKCRVYLNRQNKMIATNCSIFLIFVFFEQVLQSCFFIILSTITSHLQKLNYFNVYLVWIGRFRNHNLFDGFVLTTGFNVVYSIKMFYHRLVRPYDPNKFVTISSQIIYQHSEKSKIWKYITLLENNVIIYEII